MAEEKSQNSLQFGASLLDAILQQKIAPEKLTLDQRRACLQHMLHECKWTEIEMSEILHLHRTTVARQKAKVREQNSWVFGEEGQRALLAGFMGFSEIVMARLFQKGREKEAWLVCKGLSEVFCSLGYIDGQADTKRGSMALVDILNRASLHRDSNSKINPQTNGNSA